MARALGAGTLLVCAFVAAPALADCRFDANYEIVNPFDSSCGGVILTYTENDDTGSNVALGYPVPRPVDSLTAVDGFRSYASLFARHQDLMSTHPESVQGSIVGQTVAGRDIWAYRIGDIDATTADGRPEPAVLLNGAIHAREWQTPEAITEIFEQLIEMQDDGRLGKYLHDNLNVIIVPVLNIDGFLQTQAFPAAATAHVEQPRDGRMRRKNLRNPSSGGAIDADLSTAEDNFWGVDLNRNSAEGFAQNGGSSASVTSLIYRGAAPDSEPEILALQAAAALGPVERLRLYADLHSFSQIFFTPMTGNERRDAVTADLVSSLRAVLGSKYRFGVEPAGLGIGTTADHFARGFGIPAWTHELEPLQSGADYGGTGASHSGFILPDSQVARMRDEIARTYLLGFYRQAGPPRVAAVEIRDARSNAVRYRADWIAEGAGARRLGVSVNAALVPGNSYRLWVAFDKPMRFRNASGAIAAWPGQPTRADTGSAVLEIDVAGGTDVDIPIGNAAAWLDVAGGAPDGYRRYADDALAVEFLVPASLTVPSPAPAVLAIDNQGISGLGLDADPSTPADFADGVWINYEDVRGIETDAGGVDCFAKPFVAMDPDAAAPSGSATCRAAAMAPAPEPPPPPAGGGGAIGIGTLLLFAMSVFFCSPSLAAPPPLRIAITIDDLPWNGALPADESEAEALQRIAAVLRVHDAPATGFVICDAAATNEQAIRSWASWGLELGNHSAAHRDLNRTPLKAWLEDVSSCQEYLRQYGDATSRWFRFPLLHQGPDAETRSAVADALDGLDLETAHVTVDTSEWLLARAYANALEAADGEARYAIGREFVRHVVAATGHASAVAERKLGHDIPHVLLLHANALVAEHLDDLLLELRARGAVFISLEEALADPAYARRDDYVGPKGLSWLYRMQPASPQDVAWDDAEAESIRALFPDTSRGGDAAARPEAGSRIGRQAVASGAPPGLARAIAQASTSERMRSLLIMHRGRLVAEAYFNGAGPGTAANLKSVTKTVLSALVGVGLQQGWIGSLDDPIAHYLPELFSQRPDSPQASITLRQLLTMSSGLAPVDYGAIQQSPDWIATLLAQPRIRPSGNAAFVYDTPVLQLLSAALQRASGRSLRDLANRELFGPSDAGIVYWRRDPQGLELGGNDAYMRPRDLIQLGELYRTGGVRDGRVVLPAAFVRASISGQIRPGGPTVNHGTLPVRSYGFLWWLLDGELDGSFAALGHGGQVLLVSPRRELVVLMTSRWPSASSPDHYRHIARLLREAILPPFPSIFPDSSPWTIRTAETFRDHLAAGEFEAARAMMSEDPRQWFENTDGDGRRWTIGPGGAGPWAAWDDHFRKRTEFVGWEGCERSATLTFRETNDYFQILERGWVTNQAVYLFDDQGRIEGLIIRAVGERPQGRTEEFLAWARANEPDELAYLRPSSEIDPTGDRPRRYRALLNRWRRSVSLMPIGQCHSSACP